MRKLRLASIMMALLMAVSLLAACTGGAGSSGTTPPANSGSATSEGTSGGAGSISLGIWPEDTMTDEIALHEGYVETFNAKNPDVEVVPAFYKYAPDTFIPMAQAGNLPTIFDTWFTEPQKIIRNGFAKDITDILKERGWLDMISPDILEILSDEEGRVYGVPRDAYPLGVMLNLELFEEAGLLNEDGTAQYPKTWEELAETAKAIKDATGAAGLCLLAKDNAGGWHWSNIAWAYGATLCKDNGDGTYTANLNSAEAIAAMEYIKDLRWKYDVLTADPTNEDWGTGFTALGTGDAAMYIAAVDAVMQPTYTNGLNKDSLSLVPMPAGPGGQFSLFGGTPYMFSPDATDEEVNWCLDYLEIMGKGPFPTDEAVKGMEEDAKYRQENNIPVIPRFPCWVNPELQAEEDRIVEEFSNVDMAKYNDYFEITKEAGNLRPEEPQLTQEMYALITNVLQAVVTDENADIPALMEKANSDYQGLLDAA